MNLLMWCTLVLILCSSSEEMAVAKSGHLYQVKKGQHMVRSAKRHSDGTFTSDFTRYLDRIKAKDFVEWLTSAKREGCHKDPFHAADV